MASQRSSGSGSSGSGSGSGRSGSHGQGSGGGRLTVPPALQRALAESLSRRRESEDRDNHDWAVSWVSLPVAGTDKAYVLSHRSDDAAYGIEHTVELHRAHRSVPHAFVPMENVRMYRGDRAPDRGWWTALVDLDVPGASGQLRINRTEQSDAVAEHRVK